MSNTLSFDEKIVRKLAEILNETGLSEIEVEQENCRVRVARNLTTIATVEAPTIAAAPAVQITAPSVQEAAPVDVSRHPGTVKAPMVGTAFTSATPGAEPFVKVGTKVTQGQTLLIIEAMKVMNQIKAPKEGIVTQILFKDGEPVEFDQPLFIIE